MKKVLYTLMCLLAVLAANLGLSAQEISITLNPGWNWICYPNATVMSINEAFDEFVPNEGDIVKSQMTSTTYRNGYWRGSLSQFIPGGGYLYYSTRNETTSFTFAQPYDTILTTIAPTDITAVNAIGGGMVMLPEGAHIFQYGLCWDSIPTPDINDTHTSFFNIDTTDFISGIDGLIPSTTYYLRAYIVWDNGLYYGNEVSFTTESADSGNVPTGAINGLFSVSATEQVFFSKGNLQYIGSASTPYWKFAENQWDYLGSTTGQNSTNQSVDRDLFGWGTSGYNHGATYYQPWNTSTANSGYYAYGQHTNNLYDQTGKADWGYNPISNGGNQTNQWRTLTTKEWAYLLNTRTTPSGIRYAKAKVNNVNGLILVPDYWSTIYYILNNTNSNAASFNSNVISESQWRVLEQRGAVFLPAVGYREGTTLYNSGSIGYYWSSSYDSTMARVMRFNDSSLGAQLTQYRGYGCVVRLVCPAE